MTDVTNRVLMSSTGPRSGENMKLARRIAVFAIVATVTALPASAAVCVNKFLSRNEGAAKQIVTLLTGKLTFQEAQDLAKAITARSAPPLEWVDDKGKT